MNRQEPQQTQGVALITALLIVALATIAAVAVTARQQFDIRRSANLLNGDQAYLFALGVETWAVQLLARDRAKNATDDLKEDWAKQLPPISVEGGQVAGHIEDLQGRFNLNDLVTEAGQVDAAAAQRLQRLLTALEIPPELVWPIADWIDTDIDVNPNGGAEDDVYTRLQPPYRTGNTRMVSPSELLLVKGVTRAIYLKLEPYVCALPERTPINVNTAPALVLMTLSDDITASAAQSVVEARASQPYTDTTAFTNALKSIGGLSDAAVSRIAAGDIAVASGYFLVTGDTLFGKGRTHLYSVLHRAGDGRSSVILRAQGVL